MDQLKNFATKIQEKSPIFEYYPPKNQYIGLLSIPHSGIEIPEFFKKYLSKNQIDLQQDVDFFVHELIDIGTLQNAGVAIIKANIIRTAIDLNRPKESAVLNWKMNSKGKTVVLKEMDPETLTLMQNTYYSPYYEMLKALINELENQMEKPSIVDLHSMPSRATDYHLKINPNQNPHRPHFCVSDRSGLSCEKLFIDSICSLLSAKYPNTTQNDPYFGGHITQYIQDKYPESNNIQIEINRGLYMNEESFQLTENHKELKKVLTSALLDVFEKFYQKYEFNS